MFLTVGLLFFSKNMIYITIRFFFFRAIIIIFWSLSLWVDSVGATADRLQVWRKLANVWHDMNNLFFIPSVNLENETASCWEPDEQRAQESW